MKTLIFFLLVNSCGSVLLNAQNAAEVLTRAREKCAGIASGYYEYAEYLKLPGKRDTFHSTYQCYFRNLPGDTVLPLAFHCRYSTNQEPVEKIMYTGRELIDFLQGSDVAVIFNKTSCASDIHLRKREFKFYAPLSNSDYNPLPTAKELSNPENDLAWYGEEVVSGIPCFHTGFTKFPDNKQDEDLKTIRISYQFWIQEDNFLPLQYSISHEGMMNNDPMTQYEKYVLTKYEFNKPVDEKQFTRQSILPGHHFTDFVPYKKPELLQKDSVAPLWILTSLNGDSIGLGKLKGKEVIVDFFYMDCTECLGALPFLESLNRKYKKKGLQIVGIDVYDKPDLLLSTLLSKCKITYPVLTCGKELPKQYHINSYPTLYIIDKQGKVIYSCEGYKNEIEDEVGKLVKKNL